MGRQKKREAEVILPSVDDVKCKKKKSKTSELASSKCNQDKDDLNVHEDCEPKKGRPQRRSARSNALPKSEPKTQKAKPTGKKSKIKQEIGDSESELGSFDSTDSGIVSETALPVEKCTSSVMTSENSVKNSSKSIDSSTTGNGSARSKSRSAKSVSNKCEAEPKPKRARVVTKKMKIKDEICDSESKLDLLDASVLSDPTLLLQKCEPNLAAPVADSVDSSGIGDDSSESEWEEVEENPEQSLEDYKPEIPKEGVEITIDCPELNVRRRKKKQFDEMEYIRLYINRERKEAQLNVHKTHLLCLIAHGFYVNDILNSAILKGMALSLIPSDILSLTSGRKVDKIDSDGIERLVKWFRSSFTFEMEKDLFLNVSQSLLGYFENQKSLNSSEYNLMFIVIARALGFKTRFCVSLYPLTYKAQNLIKKPASKKTIKETDVPSGMKTENKSEDVGKPGPSKPKPKPKKKTTPKEEQKEKSLSKKTTSDTNVKTARSRRSTKKSYKMSSDESGDDLKDEDYSIVDSDAEDFVKPKVSRRNSTKTPQRKSNRKVLSTDSEPPSPEHSSYKSDRILCWAEVFSKPDKQWISVECSNNLVNKPYDIESKTLQPVSYILAYDNSSYVKDVTRRYCSEYMTSTIKLRPDSEWWEETLEPFLAPSSKLDKEEENDLDKVLINKPLPTTVAGFKNHPLYALKRHLLKFEAIYPPDAAPVGFLRGEPVYARDCVAQLHSRETWLKEARVVRIGEEPYKIVKARPKWDRIAGVLRTDLPLNVFGFWQTEPYEPPIAVDGKVPRNEYGNVELFKPCMLPKGTVHLQIPGLNRIARKLGIDCCAAVVGFDGHKGAVHAVFDGFIICEEFKDTILAAWEEEQENAKKRGEEKREKRIYGNWKKLIRGLLIRERIKLKYDTK